MKANAVLDMYAAVDAAREALDKAELEKARQEAEAEAKAKARQ